MVFATKCQFTGNLLIYFSQRGLASQWESGPLNGMQGSSQGGLAFNREASLS